MRIIPNGSFSEVIITLKKPDQLTDFQFDQRVEKISELATSMKKILESDCLILYFFVISGHTPSSIMLKCKFYNVNIETNYRMMRSVIKD